MHEIRTVVDEVMGRLRRMEAEQRLRPAPVVMCGRCHTLIRVDEGQLVECPSCGEAEPDLWRPVPRA